MAAELSTQDPDRELFERAIRTLQAEIANVGSHLALDGYLRQRYAHDIAAMSVEYHNLVKSGRLSWKQAAEQAQEMRNVIMELMRSRSTPVGRAMAQKMKSGGKTMNALIAEKTRKLYGSQADFNRLSTAGRNKVYAEIIASAGRPQFNLTRLMPKLSIAGQSLVGASLAVAVYNVAKAEDKVATAVREGAMLGAGIGGGVAGGAVAGLACGPGAPVCVGIGAFVGGGLAAMGVSHFW